MTERPPSHEAPDGGAGLDFWGRSFIAGPDGEVLARAGVDEETILVCEAGLGRLDHGSLVRGGCDARVRRRVEEAEGA